MNTNIKLIKCNNYEALSDFAANLMVSEIIWKQDSLISLASGRTPFRMYQIFTNYVLRKKLDVSELKLLKMDEWVGIPLDSDSSCEKQLQTDIIEPLSIQNGKYFSFNGMSTDLKAECKRIDKLIEKSSGIDLCILGLGKNGHIGFNEPSKTLHASSHIISLSTTSKQHPMVHNKNNAEMGITIGMKTIFSSKKILLVVSGKDKTEQLKRLLTGEISTDFPASLLQKHGKVICICDKEALGDN